MQIWVDADACPGEIKDLLFRAANRTKTKATLVANQAMRTPRCEFVDSLLVSAGMNVADRRIVELVQIVGSGCNRLLSLACSSAVASRPIREASPTSGQQVSSRNRNFGGKPLQIGCSRAVIFRSTRPGRNSV